jgi:hypothetical protein
VVGVPIAVFFKHSQHTGNIPSIPVANVLVKTRSVPKHPRHILYITNIPISNVFVNYF